jgi:hypothetical protein
MSKRERLHLSQHQSIETYRDWSGRAYIAYSNGCSMFFRDRKALTRWLKIPKSIPMRASLDSWLDSLEAADADRSVKRDQPLISEAPSLSQELLATGFGPEVFSGELDESDPQHQTRTVI